MELAKIVLYIGFSLLLILTSYNIFYNLRENPTKNTVKTWSHYRHHFEVIKQEMNQEGKEINCEDFAAYCKKLKAKERIQLKNDWRDLFNLYKFQEKYYGLLKTTRKVTLYSLLAFFGSFVLSFVIFIISDLVVIFFPFS